MPPPGRHAKARARALAARAGGPHITAPMRIHCPQCQAAYDVPERLIAGGRMLRCVKCRHEWAEAAPPPPAAPPEAPSPKPPPPEPDRPLPPPIPTQNRLHQPIDPPKPPRRARLALAAAWAASALVLIGFVIALLAWQAPITAAWPPAARLYVLLGRA
ncbi:zinc-ribbon domain-containing protein [Belnapia moabensis]|uniref:zinc-ribbon domain-containing protein n=1 Tax=Belnapia moabensis TaxID=365533 RepID=UPI000A0107F2|nr:zinc-ribbon domain-containing protein [Belnapia moabensis]